MEKTAYKKILPQDVYVSILEGELVGNKSLVKVESINNSSGNNFIDLFAFLIRKYRYKAIEFYAKKMEVDAFLLSQAMCAITGLSAREWMCGYINLLARELLEDTDLSVTEISAFLNFSSQSNFSQFFRRINKCQPYECRTLKKYGKKFKYH